MPQKIKVAVIGAGPSGLSAAEVLREDSRFEVTLYEKNSWVGGKCHTVFPDGTVTNGQKGGYEVGAVAITSKSSGYNELRELICKYDIPTSRFKDSSRSSFVFKPGSPNYVKALLKPNGLLAYGFEYLRYRRSKHAGYTNRPKVLNKSLSERYSPEVVSRFSHVVQGFGYAEFEDPALTPAVLYYHQYLEFGHLSLPLHTIDIGTQGIWARIAESYEAEQLLLNHDVTSIKRSPKGVKVTANHITKDYDYVVVSTPLSAAVRYLDQSADDAAFMSKMRYNHYVTILCEVDGLDAIGTLNRGACEQNDLLGEVMLNYKRFKDSNIGCLYLYQPKGKNYSDKELIELADKSLRNNLDASIVDKSKALVYHWKDYFGHLSQADLDDGWYNKFEDTYQLKNRTLFVSSGLHFETINASVQYGTREALRAIKQWAQ